MQKNHVYTFWHFEFVNVEITIAVAIAEREQLEVSYDDEAVAVPTTQNSGDE